MRIILSDEEVYGITLFYVDIYLFVHFSMEYILLIITKRLLLNKSKHLRQVLGALFTSICNAIILTVPFPRVIKYLLTYIFITIVEIRISFAIKSVKEYIKAFVLLYALAFLAGGFLESIYTGIPWVRKHGFSIWTLFIAVCFFVLFIRKLIGMLKENKIQQCLKNVEILINGEQIFCQGLLDTGNHLYDPITGKPVLIVEKEALKNKGVQIKQEQYRVIPYHSLGKQDGMLEGFVADLVRVRSWEEDADKEEAKVIIGIYDGKLSNDGSYQMILHPLL